MKYIHRTVIMILWGILFLAPGCNGNGGEKVYTGIAEGKVYTVSSPIGEMLQKIMIREGEFVTRGSVVAVMDTTSLHLQKQELISALSQLEWQAKEVELRKQQVTDAYNNVAKKYRNNLDLYKDKAVPEQAVDDLKLQMDKWDKEKRILQAKFKSLQDQKKSLGSKLKRLEYNLERAVLNAPSDGYADKIYYNEGEYVVPITPIADLVNLSEIWSYIYVSEEMLSRIQPGMSAVATAAGSNEKFSGKVEHINSKAEFTSKEILTPDNRSSMVYGVKIIFNNEKHIIKQGMPINITLQGD